jgi:hypothetical protein
MADAPAQRFTSHALAVFKCCSGADECGTLAAAEAWEQQQPCLLSKALMQWFQTRARSAPNVPDVSSNQLATADAGSAPANHTGTTPDGAVYCNGASAFDLFASNGGNVCCALLFCYRFSVVNHAMQVPLYDSLSTHIARVYMQLNPSNLLDIGFGSGLALAPTLSKCASAAASAAPSLLLLEPSKAMLDQGLHLLKVVHRALHPPPLPAQTENSVRLFFLHPHSTLPSPCRPFPPEKWVFTGNCHLQRQSSIVHCIS